MHADATETCQHKEVYDRFEKILEGELEKQLATCGWAVTDFHREVGPRARPHHFSCVFRICFSRARILESMRMTHAVLTFQRPPRSWRAPWRRGAARRRRREWSRTPPQESCSRCAERARARLACIALDARLAMPVLLV